MSTDSLNLDSTEAFSPSFSDSTSDEPIDSSCDSVFGGDDSRRSSFAKIIYTKDFLMSLQFSPPSMVKPDKLPDLPNIICAKPSSTRRRTDSCPINYYSRSPNANYSFHQYGSSYHNNSIGYYGTSPSNSYSYGSSAPGSGGRWEHFSSPKYHTGYNNNTNNRYHNNRRRSSRLSSESGIMDTSIIEGRPIES